MSDDSIEQQVAAGDDLLWGCQEIADYIGLSLREVQYLVRKKKLSDRPAWPKIIVCFQAPTATAPDFDDPANR